MDIIKQKMHDSSMRIGYLNSISKVELIDYVLFLQERVRLLKRLSK